jgi:acyl-CoA reductase-like NAD-dependent aldehyde dehydrogenase
MIGGDILIGFHSVSGKQRDFRAVNPTQGEELEPGLVFSGRKEFLRACQLAWEAFHLSRATGMEERAKFLECIADNVMQIFDALSDRTNAESGLPQARIETERQEQPSTSALTSAARPQAGATLRSALAQAFRSGDASTRRIVRQVGIKDHRTS